MIKTYNWWSALDGNYRLVLDRKLEINKIAVFRTRQYSRFNIRKCTCINFGSYNGVLK